MKTLEFCEQFIFPILTELKTQTTLTSTGIQKGDCVQAVIGDGIYKGMRFAQLTIKDRYKKKLGDFDSTDFMLEGVFDKARFVEVWEKVHAGQSPDPNASVNVLRFDCTFSIQRKGENEL
ncbi:MAG: hypothetical protein WCE81_00665 [Halobacteriota archaeon]